jgi:hypothetical protein
MRLQPLRWLLKAPSGPQILKREFIILTTASLLTSKILRWQTVPANNGQSSVVKERLQLQTTFAPIRVATARGTTLDRVDVPGECVGNNSMRLWAHLQDPGKDPAKAGRTSTASLFRCRLKATVPEA